MELVEVKVLMQFVFAILVMLANLAMSCSDVRITVLDTESANMVNAIAIQDLLVLNAHSPRFVQTCAPCMEHACTEAASVTLDSQETTVQAHLFVQRDALDEDSAIGDTAIASQTFTVQIVH